MSWIRLRLRRGYRHDVVEVRRADVLLGSHPECGVVVDGAASRHAWLLPRRGRLLLAPDPQTPRRPAVGGRRIDAPIVLGTDARFDLGDVRVSAQLVAGPPTLSGRTVGPWRCGRETSDEGLALRCFEATSVAGPGRVISVVEQVDPRWRARLDAGTATYTLDGALAWAHPGAPGITMRSLLEAQASAAIVWPTEAAVVLITQLAEALFEHHRRFGPHGALRPELVSVDVEGRVSLTFGPPSTLDLRYQPEAVRLGAAPDFGTDGFGWWRIAHRIASRFGLKPLRRLLPVPPRDAPGLLAAAEGVRRWAVDRGLDPTAMHLARGVRIAQRVPPLARLGASAPQTVDENERQRG